MTTRNDVHAPSRINPDDYQYVALECLKIEDPGAVAVLLMERERFRAHQAAHPGAEWSHHEHGGNCMVCGSVNAIYTVVFYHVPTNTYVRLGTDCAEKMDMGDAAAFRAFRASVDDARKLQAGKHKAQAVLGDLGLSDCWPLYTAERTGQETYEARTIQDIVGKLVQYGSLSEKQVSFAKHLLDRHQHAAEIKAQHDAERALAPDVPEGRYEVTGTVMAVKAQEYGFFTRMVMTVKADAGYLVWGTRPDSLDGVKHGDRVTFRATVTRSDRDAKFGFFKRPTNAKVVAVAQVAQEVK